MPLSAAQIITQACQIAKCPGYTVQAGQFLNMILADLCQSYDFEVSRGVYNFTFNSMTGNQSGPYVLPADWLRAKDREVFYTIQGVVYPMIKIELSEYDWLVQQAGLQSFPSFFTTDTSQTPPVMFVWVPPSGSFPVTARYYRQMPDLPTSMLLPPWFPNQNYLVTRLAGELMRITNDDRAGEFLGEQAGSKDMVPGAGWILKHYLQMQGDRQDIVSTVQLDRRTFNRATDLKNTKTIGW